MCRILKSVAFHFRSGTIGRANDHKWMMSIHPSPKTSNLITLWPWHVNADSHAKIIDCKNTFVARFAIYRELRIIQRRCANRWVYIRTSLDWDYFVVENKEV